VVDGWIGVGTAAAGAEAVKYAFVRYVDLRQGRGLGLQGREERRQNGDMGKILVAGGDRVWELHPGRSPFIVFVVGFEDGPSVVDGAGAEVLVERV
jgi:hypothetical protein